MASVINPDSEETPELEKSLEDELGRPDFSFGEDDEPEILEVKETEQKKSGAAGEMFALMIGMSFNLVAARKGEHWKLKAEEAQELAVASDAAIEEYMPDFEVSPIWVLGAVGAGIMIPRIAEDARISALEDSQKTQGKTDESDTTEQ
jgi:hypothetical protein